MTHAASYCSVRSLIASVVLLILWTTTRLDNTAVDAFVMPAKTAFISTPRPTVSCNLAVSPPLVLWNADEEIMLSSIGSSNSADAGDTMSLFSTSASPLLVAEGVGGVLLTIASVVGIAVFLFGALLLITANIIIPKAAEELEVKARKEYPELWAQTEAQLQDGEVLAMRPDLIQSLGQQVQQGDLAKFKELERTSVEGTETTIMANTATTNTTTTDVDLQEAVDVEVITSSKDDKDQGGSSQ